MYETYSARARGARDPHTSTAQEGPTKQQPIEQPHISRTRASTNTTLSEEISSYKPVTDSTGNAHAQLGLGFTLERER